ncbi:MAG: SGNH/GDSL hydrolase family protein [Alphaproteobacteria bacterium]|nr:SGNH/GDSL hydrolase family protein [Alphaproteobacteria bacterium]
MSRTRRFALALATTLLALVAAMAGTEAWFRIHPPPAPAWDMGNVVMSAAGSGACLEPHLTAGYAPVPGACSADADGLLSYRTGQGEPTTTILVLGDSVASSGDKWVRGAADVAAAATGRVVEVRNAAVTGYDLCQSTERLRELIDLRGLRPDLIVLQACTNDLRVTPLLARAANGDGLIYDGQGERRIPALLLRSRAATWLVVQRLARQRDPRRHRHLSHAQAAACVASVGATAARLGVPALYVVPPALLEPGEPAYEATRATEQELTTFGYEGGLRVLSLRPALEAAGPLPSLRVHPGDHVHLSSERHIEIISPVLGEAIVDALDGTLDGALAAP